MKQNKQTLKCNKEMDELVKQTITDNDKKKQKADPNLKITAFG